jgi:MbtH protein
MNIMPEFSEPQFLVVANSELQYSIWPQDKPLPSGWSAEGFGGTREACLTHIEKVWVDMTPKSLRNSLAQ